MSGLCTNCGKRPSADAGTTCEPCREARRSYERSQYVRGLPLYPPGQGTPRRCPLHDDPVHSLS